MNKKDINLKITFLESNLSTMLMKDFDTTIKYIEKLKQQCTNQAQIFQLNLYYKRCWYYKILKQINEQNFINVWNIYYEYCKTIGNEDTDLNNQINRKFNEYIFKIEKQLKNLTLEEKNIAIKDMEQKLPSFELEHLRNKLFKDEFDSCNDEIIKSLEDRNYKNAYKIAFSISYSDKLQNKKIKDILNSQKCYIDDLFDKYQFSKAKQLILKIIEDTPDKYKKEIENYFINNSEFFEIKETIENLILNGDYVQADNYFKMHQNVVLQEEYDAWQIDCVKKIFTEINQSSLSDNYNKVFEKLKLIISDEKFYSFIFDEFFNLLKSLCNADTILLDNFLNSISIDLKGNINLIFQLLYELNNFNFSEADNLYKKIKNIPELQQYDNLDLEYQNSKSCYIKKFFDRKLNININKEQSAALANISQNLLVKARAGSGKTRTIACRAFLALETEKYKPEEIMLLAFNKNAAEEISNRIYNDFKCEKFNKRTARTFHSLAYGILNPEEDILKDDTDKHTKQSLTNFISKLYHCDKIWNENFEKLIYQYYRESNIKEIENDYFKLLTEPEKYEYLRNLRRITLNGEKVKSNGEKWIADFLFEHNIKYSYEKLFSKSKNGLLYKPDFTIYYNNKQYILEHWGIDENDSNKQVPLEWTKTWDEYYDEIQFKRDLCNYKNITLLETSIADMKDNTRNSFEHILKERLEKNGVKCKKLPFEAIFAKIQQKHKDDMAAKFAQFISFAQKSKITPEYLDNELKKTCYQDNARDFSFITMANTIYHKYHEELKINNKIDYDNIMLRAIKRINDTNGECSILLGKTNIKIKDIKFILIDEFQDFSLLFLELITSIIKFNKKIKLFCVGDDWQAINGFAGSKLAYFKEFKDLFINSDIVTLPSNYRCGEKIINASNVLMKTQGGIPAKCKNSNTKSILSLIYLDDIDYKGVNNIIDSTYLEKDNNFFNIHNRYIKQCVEIIKENIDKTFIIQNRTNKLASNYDLRDLRNCIENILKNEFDIILKPNQIKVDTIHKFKGLEADIVIILECDEGKYPFVHPDSTLYTILGRSPLDVLNEERRLFYVALTRAREKVYCICSKQNESGYIKELVDYFETKYNKINLKNIAPEIEDILEHLI